MQQYSILEANHHLPTLIDKVERGESIELTKQGKAVAVLLSEREYQRLMINRPSPWEALQTFRQAVNIEQLEIDTDIFMTPRTTDQGREIEL